MYALNTLSIRRATQDDDQAIAALWRQSWASANRWATDIAPLEAWLERVRTEFRAPKDVVLSLDEQGEIGSLGDELASGGEQEQGRLGFRLVGHPAGRLRPAGPGRTGCAPGR